MNPFIQLLERPIITLTITGYILAMVAISLGGNSREAPITSYD